MVDKPYEGAPANVWFELDTSSDPDNFGNLYVHVASGDGSECQPGRVFRAGRPAFVLNYGPFLESLS